MPVRSLAADLRKQAQNGSVVLDRRLLTSPRARRLLDGLLGVEQLVLFDPSVEAIDDQTRIAGRMDILGVERIPAVVALKGSDEECDVRIELRLPEGWTLAQSFAGCADSDIGRSAFTEPCLVLDTSSEQAATLVDALRFRGRLGADALVPSVTALIGQSARFEVEGTLCVARSERSVAEHAAVATDVKRLTDKDAEVSLQVDGPVPLSGSIGSVSLSDVRFGLHGPWVADPQVRRSERRRVTANVDIADRRVELVGSLTRSIPILNLRATPTDITLGSLAELAQPLGGDAAKDLPDALRALRSLALEYVEVELDLSARRLLRLGLGVRLPLAWEPLPGLVRANEVHAHWLVVDPAGHRRQLASLVLDAEIAGSTATLRAIAPEFVLGGTLEELRLGALLRTLGGSLEHAPDITIKDIAISVAPQSGELAFRGHSTDTWRLDIGPGGIEIGNFLVDVQRTRSDGKHHVHGVLSGRVEFTFGVFDVEFKLPGAPEIRGRIPVVSLSMLLQELIGAESVRDTPLPAGLLELELRDVYLRIAPADKSVSVAATSPLGEVEFVVDKDSAGWGFVIGFRPAEGWRISSLAPELAPLDVLTLSRPTLVLASRDDASVNLATLTAGRTTVDVHRDRVATGERVAADVAVQRGLNLYADLALAGTGLDQVLGIEALQVYAAIGTRASDMALEAAIEFDLQLGEGVSFNRAALRLRPAPPSFVATLLGELSVHAGSARLEFVGGLEVHPRGATLQATMRGEWNEPFGLSGLAAANVAVDLGLTFAPLLPTIGIAGSLRLGEIDGRAAVRFDSSNPGRSMFAVAFERLSYALLIRSLCPPVAKLLDGPLMQLLDGFAFRDVDVYVVPMPTRIGEIEFEPGMRAKGTLELFGLEASLDARFDPTSGVVASGAIQPIRAGDIFVLEGLDGGPATFDLDLRRGHPAHVWVQGRAKLLGLAMAAQLRIEPDGIALDVVGRVFDAFEAELHVRGRGLQDPFTWSVEVAMRTDFLARVRADALDAIRQATEEATRKLSDAQADIQAAKREVDRLNGTIESVRETIRSERQRDAERLASAARAVADAQVQVRSLDDQIASARATVQAERNRDAGRLVSAQQAVRSAQGDVDSLQRSIDSAKSAIESLKSDISAKKRWLDGKKWYEKTWAGPEYAAYAAAKGTVITARYTEIGALETARATAIGVLEGAKQVLRGAEAAARTIPVDADPRVAGLFAARGTAIGVLEGAKQSLKGMETAAREMPIDADVRVAGLIASRETAKAAMDAATLALEAVKQSVGGAAEVASFVVDKGLGGVLDVRAASFRGELAGVSGGSVDVSLTLSFLGKPPETLRARFDLHNPALGAKRLAESLIGR